MTHLERKANSTATNDLLERGRLQPGFQHGQDSWHDRCEDPTIVTLRITDVPSDEGTFLRIDGRLEAESVDELEKACEAARPPLTLNLEGLLWIDERATKVLLRIEASGAILTSATPYVALRLNTKGE